jgi:Mce-associated membrane protein
VLVVLSALLVVACVVLGWLVWSHKSDSSDLRDARAAALTAARQEVVNLHTISYKTVDADFARVIAGTTGTFKDQFSRAQTDLKPIILQSKAITSGKVLSAGLVKGDLDSATVVLGVDRTVTDATDPDGAVNHFRYRLTLEKHGGRWLVSKLDDET